MPHCIAAVAGPGDPGCSSSTGATCNGDGLDPRMAGAVSGGGGCSSDCQVGFLPGRGDVRFFLRAVHMRRLPPSVTRGEVVTAFGHFGAIRSIGLMPSNKGKNVDVFLEFVAAASATAA